MKKSVPLFVLFALVFILLFIGNVLAANETVNGDAVARGYQCLQNQIKGKTLSLQEAVFTVFALGNEKSALDVLANEQNGNCWSKKGCTLKETAQASMAYKRVGKKTSDSEQWLLSKNASASDLTWYLEIDISQHGASACKVNYDGSDHSISIGTDMKLQGNPGSCLSVSSSGYWLQVKENCFDKDFKISCDRDFVSTLLYEKKVGAGTVYVSSQTHSAAALGTTEENVQAKCFKLGGNCDYEGSLWAALALHNAGIDVSAFLPYLVALAEDNQKYFPAAFLYLLTGSEDQYNEIVQLQKQERSWKMIGSPYGELYDTSLGLLALSTGSSTALENTKSYLLSIQSKEGCWNNNNIRDTAFILYAGWTKKVSGTNSGGSTSPVACTDISTQSCSLADKCLDAGGRILSSFSCSGVAVCCSVLVKEQTCKEQKGNICSGGQECSGKIVSSSDKGTCCLDACAAPSQENSCEIAGGACSASCDTNQQADSSLTCSSGQLCCKQTTATSSGGANWILILILGILILLVILGIIYRDKLRVWWYTRKGKTKISPVVKPGVSSGGHGFTLPSRPTRLPQRPAGTPLRRSVTPQDKEMEETLKKLRDMSK